MTTFESIPVSTDHISQVAEAIYSARQDYIELYNVGSKLMEDSPASNPDHDSDAALVYEMIENDAQEKYGIGDRIAYALGSLANRAVESETTIHDGLATFIESLPENERPIVQKALNLFNSLIGVALGINRKDINQTMLINNIAAKYAKTGDVSWGVRQSNTKQAPPKLVFFGKPDPSGHGFWVDPSSPRSCQYREGEGKGVIVAEYNIAHKKGTDEPDITVLGNGDRHVKAILSGTNQVTRIDVNFGDNSPVWRADNSTLQLYIPDGRTSITEALADYGPDRHVDLIAQVAKQEAGFRQDITETFRPISVGKINPTPVLVAKRN